ncbi:DUF5958 family protein [Streptomyces sp. NPDC095817]|uniref:DUF5958 family protein n=1 Tax=Streptomyces sp. NPDC095817 TaxID=3155082 RepID=UPI003316FDE0
MDLLRSGFAALPVDEHVKALRVLVSVFSVADTRRRQTSCRDTCGPRGTLTRMRFPGRCRWII